MAAPRLATPRRTSLAGIPLPIVIAGAIAVLFPLIGLLPILDSVAYGSLIGVLRDSMIYVLLAVGLNIVVGYAGLLDLGYAAFFAIGGYTMAFLTSPGNPINNAVKGIPVINTFWGALIICFLVAALFGVLLGAPTLGLRGDYLAIVTLGFGEIVPIVFLNARDYTNGDTGLSGIQAPRIGPFDASWMSADTPLLGALCQNSKPCVINLALSPIALVPWYYLALAVIFLSIFLIRRMLNSRLGRAWQAMREDEIAAGAMGIDLVRTKLLAFGLGASFAGFAGGIYASSVGAVGPSQIRFDVSVVVLAMVILGGMGNIWGVIAGAVLIRFVDSYIVANLTSNMTKFADSNQLPWLNNLASASRLFIFGLVLVLVMLFRPEGLLPNARRKAEFEEAKEESAAPEELQKAEETKKELLGLQGTERGVSDTGLQ